MAWTVPIDPPEVVDAAGERLIADLPRDEEYWRARNVAENWRDSHMFPLNTFQVYLRRVSHKIDPSRTVVQRMKRLTSMESKLRRFHSTVTLSTMQDIGGCRAIFRTAGGAFSLWRAYKASRIQHELVDEKDYIKQPKRDGYRGIHLVYRFRSGRTPDFDGLRIELQFRSRPQHAWATAVEVVDTFTGQNLKTGGGEGDWKRFFLLMSAVIAKREGCPTPWGMPKGDKLLSELRPLEERLRVRTSLRAYRVALVTYVPRIKPQKSQFVLLLLDHDKKLLQGKLYGQPDEAARQRTEAERRNEGQNVDVVLVQATSMSALAIAYPNYYQDAEEFLGLVDAALGPL